MTKAKTVQVNSIVRFLVLWATADQTNYPQLKLGLEKATAVFWRQKFDLAGITVNCLLLGSYETEYDEGLPEEQQGKLVEKVPASRLVTQKKLRRQSHFWRPQGRYTINPVTLHGQCGINMS